MKKSLMFGWIVAAGILLSACAGTAFERPADDKFVLGKSTPADVQATMGEPRQTGEVTKNNMQLKSLNYAYASKMDGDAAYPDVTPSRGMTFFFYKDALVAQQFVSSFKDSSTDFDGSKVPSIVKGTSTRSDVVNLFGKPTGQAIYPFIAGTDDTAYIYSYGQVKGGVFNMKFHQQALVVSFDKNGVVTNVEYTSVGEK